MKLLAVGLNHRTAPLEVRERLALNRGDLPAALELLKQCAGQGVVLSTCNRTEVYTLAASSAQGQSQVEPFFSHLYEDLEDLSPYLYTLEHLEAVRHLFCVACGLDSLILGETEILGQVREAYGSAVAGGAAHGVLSHIFHHTLRVGKRARRETGISRNALSISSACVELARRALGDLHGKEVLVIGLGEAGKLAARALTSGGAGSLWVTNRTYQRAVELAEDLGGTAAPFEEMAALLERVDMVVSTTGAPGYILAANTLEEGMERRQGVPLFLVDIAVPRDIDPAAAALSGVTLCNMDDLEAVSEWNRLQREQEAERVEAIVEEEVQRFARWYAGLELVPIIASLQQYGESVRRREVAKTLKRLAHLSEEEQERIDALTKAIVKKLLHHPIALLKNGGSAGAVPVVQELFRLDEGGMLSNERDTQARRRDAR